MIKIKKRPTKYGPCNFCKQGILTETGLEYPYKYTYEIVGESPVSINICEKCLIELITQFLDNQEKEADKQLRRFSIKIIVAELTALKFPKKSVYGFANLLLEKSSEEEVMEAIKKSKAYIFNLPYQKKYAYILSLLEEEMI